MSEEKAYVVVRSDISPGYQIVQSAHAVAEHEALHPGSMAGRTMVVLSIQGELLLMLLHKHIESLGVAATKFWEPDVLEYTAMAVSPSVFSGYLFSGFPLAGK